MNEEEKEILEKKCLPCPFCPHKDVKKSEAYPIICYYKENPGLDAHYTIQCSSCGCEPHFYAKTIEEAILVWNERKGEKMNVIDYQEIVRLSELVAISKKVEKECLAGLMSHTDLLNYAQGLVEEFAKNHNISLDKDKNSL
jgi:hypothetical protein